MKKYLMGGLIGAICGDALGVPYEFNSRKHMKNCNVDGMVGYGTHHQPRGTWSDDTSMTLATIDSLKKGVDYEDMMNKYCDWINNASYTPHGETFDYGRTTFYALRNYWYDHKPVRECGLKDIRSNGNGSLMRILPVTYYCYYNALSVEEQVELIGDVSALTHAHPTSKASCNIYNFIIQRVLRCKEEGLSDSLGKCIHDGLADSYKYYNDVDFPELSVVYDIDSLGSWDNVGSRGYVVDTLRTAVMTCLYTSSYRDAVLQTVLLGGDTDTNAMVTGGLAGLYYGIGDVPREWCSVLVKRDYLYSLCEEFVENLLNE